MSELDTGVNKYFPVEIWENILRFMDVLVLLKFKTVSTTFHDIITVLIEKECKWHEKCVKEIPESFWSSLLKHQNHSEISCKDFHALKKQSRVWIAMYKSWIGWSALTEKTPIKKTCTIINDITNPDTVQPEYSSGQFIHGMDALSGVVALGDEDGLVIFYEISKLYDRPFFHRTQNAFTVTDIRLCKKGNRMMAIALLGSSVMQYWDVESRRLTRQTLEPVVQTVISTSYEFFSTVQLIHQSDRHYILTVKRLEVDGHFEGVRSFVIPVGRSESFITVFMDGDKVILRTRNHIHKRSNIHTCTEDSYHVHSINEPWEMLLDEVKFLSQSVAVCFDRLAADTRVGFSIGGSDWKSYDEREDFHLMSTVNAVCYHVGLLIFGLGSGQVCIIHVGEIDSAETLDRERMRNAKRKILELGTRPIDYLDVTEYNSNQYVVAATRKRLHIIKFI